MDWVSYIKTSENQALKEIYRSHRSPCMSWLQETFEINSEDAKEIFQDSIITIYDQVITGKLESLDGSIRTYLYGIAKNKYRDFYRAVKRDENKKKPGNITKGIGNKERIILEARINHVDAVLHSMGAPCKLLLQLYYYKRKSITEIGDQLGYNNNEKLIQQKSKCIKRLERLIHHHINIDDDIES